MLLVEEAQGISNFCNSAAGLLQYLGYAIFIFKIAIPLIIIVFGMMDFGKAVVAEKDDEIKKNAIKLGRRAIAGVIIFFIPSIIIWLFKTIPGYKADEFSVCETCLLKPSDQTCNSAATNAKNKTASVG